MHKNLLLVFLSVLIQQYAKGQINMALQISPTGIMQKNQLWNLALVNTSNTVEYVHIVLTILDADNNQPLLTGKTKVVTINKGALQLKASDLGPIQYNYLSSSFNVDRNADGFLPIGNFTACYAVFKQENEGVVELVEDCIPLEVTPLHPPLLNTPSDEEVIETKYPQFTWLPPSPANLISNLTYDLILTEVLKGQTSSQAIQNNVPIYNVGNYKTLFNNYPSSNKSLDTGKLYAWRIVAKNSNQFIAQSDVWTFTIGKNSKQDRKNKEEPFVELKRDYDAALVICSGSLRFAYNNEANDSSLRYRIISSDDGKGTVIKDGNLSAVFGQNFFDISLHLDKHFKNNKTYILQVFNSRNEQWKLNFSYINPKDSN